MKIPMLCAIGAVLALGAAEAEAADPAAGEELYGTVCANCHGPAGRGMASFPKLAGREADYLASRLMQYRAGERVGPNSALMMPNAEDLSDDDIANLSAYLAQQPG